MKLALLGASGPTGRLVIAAALREGHLVRALARPSRPGSGVRGFPLREGLSVFAGDALVEPDVVEVVRGSDAVISLVGPGRDSPADLCSKSAEALVRACRAADVSRVVLVSGAMIGHPAEHAHGVYRIVPHLLGAVREDRLHAERAVSESGLAWTIVRPPRLGDGPTEGWVTLGADIEIGTMDAIPRIDLAEALVDVVARERFVGQGVAARTAHRDERTHALRVPLSRVSDSRPLPPR